MATGYEVKGFADLARIARALERIADALEQQTQRERPEGDGDDGPTGPAR